MFVVVVVVVVVVVLFFCNVPYESVKCLCNMPLEYV